MSRENGGEPKGSPSLKQFWMYECLFNGEHAFLTVKTPILIPEIVSLKFGSSDGSWPKHFTSLIKSIGSIASESTGATDPDWFRIWQAPEGSISGWETSRFGDPFAELDPGSIRVKQLRLGIWDIILEQESMSPHSTNQLAAQTEKKGNFILIHEDADPAPEFDELEGEMKRTGY